MESELKVFGKRIQQCFGFSLLKKPTTKDNYAVTGFLKSAVLLQTNIQQLTCFGHCFPTECVSLPFTGTKPEGSGKSNSMTESSATSILDINISAPKKPGLLT